MSGPKSLRASIAARIQRHSTLVSILVLAAIVAVTLPKMYPRETFDSMVESISDLRGPQDANTLQLLRLDHAAVMSGGPIEVEPIENEKTEFAASRTQPQSAEG